MFRDFCDVSGFLPKVKVGDAVRCLGENPLQSEVTRTLTLHFGHALICYVQIADLTKKFSGQGLTFEQFEEVVRICRAQNQSPTDEVRSGVAVLFISLASHFVAALRVAVGV